MNTKTFLALLSGTLLASSALTATAATHYVNLNNSSPVPPYLDWATAATSIQNAVDVATAGDEILVDDGVYQTGARTVYGMNNRVALTKAVVVRSVNGPGATTIYGASDPETFDGGYGPQAVRCAYLTNGAVLSGFTLTNGTTQRVGYIDPLDSGGGVWCESSSAQVTNCVFSGNKAHYYGGAAYSGTLNNCTLTGNFAGAGGGGAYAGVLTGCTLTGNRAGEGYGGGVLYGTLDNCTLTGNSASKNGGGAYLATLNNCSLTGNSASGYGGGATFATLNNCTLTGNSASSGGGAYGGTLRNCILYYNTAPTDLNYTGSPRFNFCCTTPLPLGSGNFTDAPLFVDTNGWVNLRLQPGSPCINAGNNAYARSVLDLDGNPRIVGGTVDVGAYEFQSPASRLSYAWLQSYGLPTDGSADYLDSEHDGMNNWQEWVAGTDPTDSTSVLQLLLPNTTPSGLLVSWSSVANRSYFLERGTNLGGLPVFALWQSNLPGQPDVSSITDTNAPGAKSLYYRVGVQP